MASATVTIYRNGDNNYPGKKVVINRRQIRSMDALLDKVTKDTSMRNAARSIKTPTGGHTIKELDSLETGGCYVAVGAESFKRLQYTEIKVQNKSTPRKEIEITPVTHSRLIISGRARKVADEQPHNHRTIHVFRNGDDLYPSHKMLLDKRDLSSMDTVLKIVTSKVRLQSGAVFWLFTVDGREIKEPSELENGGQYVAVGHGKKFKRLAYSDQGNVLSPRSRVPTKTQIKVAHARNIKPNRTKNGAAKGSRRKTSSTSNSQASSSQSAYDELLGKGGSLKQEVKQIIQEDIQEEHKTKPNRRRIEEEFKTRPLEFVSQEFVSQEIIQDDIQEEYISQPPLERSPSPRESVYQASGENSVNAREVQDDKEVKEDKPIDQMPAEEVEEEIGKENDENKDKNKESVNAVEKENSGIGGFLEDLVEDIKDKFDDDDDEEQKKKEENLEKKEESPAGN